MYKTRARQAFNFRKNNLKTLEVLVIRALCVAIQATGKKKILLDFKCCLAGFITLALL